MPDLTPHLGPVVGDLVDRLTIAGIGISTLVIRPAAPAPILLFPATDRRLTVADALRVLPALAATDVTVSAPYGATDPQVNVDGTVTLAGQTIVVGLITSPETSEETTP